MQKDIGELVQVLSKIIILSLFVCFFAIWQSVWIKIFLK